MILGFIIYNIGVGVMKFLSVVFIHMRLNILDGFIILIYFIGIDLAKYGEGLKLIKIYIFIFKIFLIKINLH